VPQIPDMGVVFTKNIPAMHRLTNLGYLGPSDTSAKQTPIPVQSSPSLAAVEPEKLDDHLRL